MDELGSGSKKDDVIGISGLTPEGKVAWDTRVLLFTSLDTVSRTFWNQTQKARQGDLSPEMFQREYHTSKCLFSRDTGWYGKEVKESASRERNRLMLHEVVTSE